MPAFSNRWLEGVKKRNHIKLRVRHGEAALVGADAEEEMVENRKVILLKLWDNWWIAGIGGSR